MKGRMHVIKRPLLWILGAFMAGMYLAWRGLAAAAVFLIMLVLYLVIYTLLYHTKQQIAARRDSFVWCLPLLVILGFFDMREQLLTPAVSKAFEQETACELTGKISMIVKKQWGKALYVRNNTISLPEGMQYTCGQVIVYCYDNKNGPNQQDPSLISEYLVGNQIAVFGTLNKFSEAVNPGQFNEKQYYKIENIDFKLLADRITVLDSHSSIFHAYLDKIKNKLLCVYDNILEDKEAGTLIAMLLGDKYLLDEEIKQLYQENGISHILAISGLHVSLIGMAVFWLLKRLRLPLLPAAIIAILFIYSYGILTAFSVSTNRAVVMMTLMLISPLFGKTYDMLSAMALSALIILLQNPLQVFSVGFLLSYGAVLGICVIYPCLGKLYSFNNTLCKSLFLSFSAQIATAPVILYFFYQFPVYSILINLIILPLVTILMLTSILAGLAGAVCLPLGIFLIGGANYILKFYEGICRIGDRLPGHLVTAGRPDMLRLLLSVLFLCLFVGIVRKYEKRLAVIFLAGALVILLLPKHNAGLEVTFLDVGQGDAIYMESGRGTTYLIDGGSSDVKKVGRYRLQPFLLSKGKDTIDYAVITHSDSDHISGLKEMISGGVIKFERLILPAISDKDEAYMELEKLGSERGIEVLYMKEGDCIIDGGIDMFCLHPSPGDTYASANAYSTVLSITFGDFDLLLTGDLDREGEDRISELLQSAKEWKLPGKRDTGSPPPLDYDILKVAHHGSGYSTMEEFLELTRPELSIISCGRDNKRVTRLIQFRFPCSSL